MSLTASLSGGPPWGLRLSHDDQLRPVVAQLLPGGRASVSGVRIGDVIESVNGDDVGNFDDAYERVHTSIGELSLRLNRSGDNYHPTVRREKLSSSVHNSPVASRNSTSSVPSSPVLPRTNPHLSRNSPRQVRLDMMQGSRSTTESRRRFFEQCTQEAESNPPMTERLLKKKIQMGVQQGPPTESSYGYDSVDADFAGRSLSTSLRTSPMSSAADGDDVDEKTLLVDLNHEGPKTSNQPDPSMLPAYQQNQQQLQNPTSFYATPQAIYRDETPAGPSQTQWRIRTQTHNEMPAQGDVEAPGRRTVAALRQMINDRLEMKTPTGGLQPKTSSEGETPSWSASNVRVHECSWEDPHVNKHFLGRVLDGPVNPQKFFQGVPPPSYNVVHHNNNPQQQPVDAKPPAPPPKAAPAPRTSSTIRILPNTTTSSTMNSAAAGQKALPSSNFATNDEMGNGPNTYIVKMERENNNNNNVGMNGLPPPAKPAYRVAPPTNANAHHPYNDVNFSLNSSMESRGYPFDDVDDGASMISSCISTFGDSSEVAAFSAAGAARHLWDQFRQQQHQLNMGGQKRDEPPQPTATATTMTTMSTRPDYQQAPAENPILPFGATAEAKQEAVLPPSSLFGDIQLTPFGQSNVVQATTPVPSSTTAEAERGPSLPRSSSRHSMDLESSELLLKSRSPAPYTSTSTDHYGTIRRRHTPVRLAAETSTSAEMLPTASPGAAHVEHRSNDSGYEGSAARSPDAVRFGKDLLEPYESLSSSMLTNAGGGAPSDSRTELLSIDSRRPESFMSTSTFDDAASTTTPTTTPRPHDVATAAAAAATPLGGGEAASPPSTRVAAHTTTTASSATGDDAVDGEGDRGRQRRSDVVAGDDVDVDDDDDLLAKRLFHPTSEPEMSLWYRNMYKKMHKVPPAEIGDEPLRRQSREAHSPTPNDSRPLTPSTHATRGQRFEVDITPRRARSVGRVVEPPGGVADVVAESSRSAGGTNRYAWERSRTPHFHLPTYRFGDDDPRPFRCGFRGCGGGRRDDDDDDDVGDDVGDEATTCGTPCMRCRRPRRDASFAAVERVYSDMERRRRRDADRLQARIATRCVTDRLDATTQELEEFIHRLESTWRRSKSQPAIDRSTLPSKERTPPRALAAEIAELKRISKEEVLLRQKAERLSDELQKEKDRRHQFVPSAAPALQNNVDRFESLMKDYSYRNSPVRDDVSVTTTGRAAITTATVIYRFDAKSPRELSLNKGDVVRVTREIDAHWLEGERNGKSGIFPASYVQIEHEYERSRQKMRAVYPFTARNANELSLKKGELVTFRREIDANWMEGSNQIGQIGIFPSCYVRMFSDPPQEAPSAVVPDRPKTPKLPSNSGPSFDVDESVHPTTQQHPHQHQLQQKPTVRFEEKPTTNGFELGRNDAGGDDFQRVFPYKTEAHALDRLAEWEVRKHRDGDRRGPYQQHHQQPLRVPNSTPVLSRRDQGGVGPTTSSSFSTGPPPATATTSTIGKGADIRSNPANVIPRGSEMFRALFPYRPEKSDELELQANDIVFVVEKCDDGWFIGTSLRTGEFGTFPGNYVQRH